MIEEILQEWRRGRGGGQAEGNSRLQRRKKEGGDKGVQRGLLGAALSADKANKDGILQNKQRLEKHWAQFRFRHFFLKRSIQPRPLFLKSIWVQTLFFRG